MPPRRPSQPRSVTRTSYHVGRPWMFDGKILRGLTGTPIRKMDFANNSFADAEPEPLTLANLTTKSLTAPMGFMCPTPQYSRHTPVRRMLMATWPRIRHLEQEFAPIPGAGRATLRAQAAM